MSLKFDPYQVFKKKTTPISLYARGNWLGEGNSGKFQRDLEERVKEILQGQAIDGSWGGSVISTCQHLFDLHLTVRERTPEVENALKWLFEMDLAKGPLEKVQFERFPKQDTQILKKTPNEIPTTLPFVATPLRRLKVSMGLFFAVVFDWLAEKKVQLFFEFFANEAEHYGDWGISTSNFMRAYLNHPEYENKPFMKTIIGYLARKQTGAGDWGKDFNFYQVFNDLAHSKDPRAYQQVSRAYDLLFDTQNANGSWGSANIENPELATFLVVHGLRRTGLI